jgi:phage shock protein PspC (stress-responsive transcriptional regulator)
MLVRMWRRRNTPPLLGVGGGMGSRLHVGITTLEISLAVSHIVLPEDPAIPLLGIYTEDAPTCNQGTCSTMFIVALFIIARSWKEPRCPSTDK